MSDQPTGEINMAGAENAGPADPKKKRARIALIALTAGFGLILVVQGPTLLDAINGGGGGSGETPVAAEEAALIDAAAEAAGSDPAVLEAASSAPAPGALSDSDLPQRATVSELSRIDSFNQGDPFVPLVVAPVAETTDAASGDAATSTDTGGSGNNDAPSGDAESGSTGTDTNTSTTPASGTESTGTNTSNPDAELSGARLSINDVTQDVSSGAKFPSANPVFVVNSVTATAVQVGLVEGAFSTGTQTIDIEVGETRVLVSQPDGVRYTVRYDEGLSN